MRSYSVVSMYVDLCNLFNLVVENMFVFCHFAVFVRDTHLLGLHPQVTPRYNNTACSCSLTNGIKPDSAVLATFY